MLRKLKQIWRGSTQPGDAVGDPAPISEVASPIVAVESADNSATGLPTRAGRSRTALVNLTSFTVHLVLLLICAQLTVSGSAHILHELHAWTADENVEAAVEAALPPTDLTLAEPSDTESDSVFSTESASYSRLNTGGPQVDVLEPVEMTSGELALNEIESVGGLDLEELVMLRGSAGEKVGTVEGAVDRLTHEIVANLEQGNVLVVWLMDASISLVDDREAVAGRLERVFRELEKVGLQDEALLNAVVGFGSETAVLLPPSSDGSKVVSAIRNVPTDDTGVENVFTAIMQCVERYKSLRARDHRRMMFIVWTDESGDDYDRLDDVIRVCQKLAIPVFTVGPSSMFGRQKGVHAYKRPEDGKVYQIAVDRGPDSVQYELLQLPYWFDGPQFERLPAGIGPFALTRLAIETGGAYFINDDKSEPAKFSLDQMRRYMPDYSSAAEYRRQIQRSHLRQAIRHAVDLTLERDLKREPRLEFEPTGDNFQQQLRDAQQTVAFNAVTLEHALALFGPKGLESEYEQEQSPRWRAWYDLTYGRLLAMYVRCGEYNWTCAEMRGRGADFVNQQSNHWKFKPSATLKVGTGSERPAAEAERLLRRCVEQNPGTPWAALAQRELDYPFGFEIEERFVPRPPSPSDLGGANTPMMGRRVEQPRRIQRPEEVPLPKL